VTISGPLTPGTLQRLAFLAQSPRVVRAAATRGVYLPFRASRSALGASSAFGPSALGLTPLGADPRRLRALRDRRLCDDDSCVSRGVGRPLGGPRPGRLLSRDGVSFRGRSASRGFPSPSALGVDESTGTGSPGPAVAPLVPFPRLQRLAPRSTVPGLSPGNARGVWGGLQGFSLAWIGRRRRLPPLVAFPARASRDARPLRLQGFVPHANPWPPAGAGARSLLDLHFPPGSRRAAAALASDPPAAFSTAPPPTGVGYLCVAGPSEC
jgi:hypothetical protein